jgi:putative phosphoserine phosphatase/1-acylglycerol-3-phosphate O-acyltransferase
VGRVAALFDLDRTVISGSSADELTASLVEAGLALGWRPPGLGLLHAAYDRFGENVLMMGLARLAVMAAKGWPVDQVAAAAESAASRLADRVAPYLPLLLEDHRRDGVITVLATTSPEVLVRPLAERLGFDDLIATRYAVFDGRFTGGLEGPFVWSTGKLGAARAWAEANGVDLEMSHAYSDSVFDVPLLSAVGHPHAVNPDLALRLYATAQRWPCLWLDAPPGVPKFAGVEPFDVVRALSHPALFPFVRFDIAGQERLPRSGPAIIVANHRSYFDTVAIAMTVAPSGRPLRFLGKKEVFDAPVVGDLATALGGIRVDRGSGSGAPMRAAERALRAGEMVALMPQGTIPRGRAFFDPVLSGRPGAARLAAASGARVVPIGLWGTELVWPRNERVPRVWDLADPPTVRVRVGTAVRGLGGGEDSDTERIMRAIGALLPAEARRPHEPTDDELRRTFPPG